MSEADRGDLNDEKAGPQVMPDKPDDDPAAEHAGDQDDENALPDGQRAPSADRSDAQ